MVGEVLRVTPPNGPPFNLDFGKVETGASFRGALLSRTAELVGPSGSWGSEETVRFALTALRSFFRGLDVKASGDLTGLIYRKRLLSWSPSVRRKRHMALRAILANVAGVSPDTIRAIESLSTSRNRTGPGIALTDGQVESLRETCFDTVRDALARVRRGWAVVEALRRGEIDEAHPDFTYAQFLDEVSSTGDIARRFPSDPTKRIVPISVARRLYPTGNPRARTMFPLWADLYPTTSEIAAALLGLIITCGWNLSVATSLTTDEISRVDARDGSEPVHLRVRLHKPRRGPESDWTETYSDNGPRSKARLLQTVLGLTEGVRQTMSDTGRETNALLVSLAKGFMGLGEPPFMVLGDAGPRTVMNYLSKWRDEHPELDFATPRALRSFFTTRVHPQGHSLSTNLDYNLKDPTVRKAIQPVVASALEGHYKDIQARVLAAASATLGDLPERHRNALDEVNSGARDTVVAACLDHNHHPDTNEPCRASFLTCFTCKNAVVLKRHLPRITALHDHLEHLRTVVQPGVWSDRFAMHHSRVGSLLQPDRHFSAADIGTARHSITDLDRERAARLMNRIWDA